jgi:hypothetical protein
MPIHNLTKQQLSTLWQQIQHNKVDTPQHNQQTVSNVTVGSLRRQRTRSIHRAIDSATRFLRKDRECQQRNVAWRCESAPLVAERWRGSSGGSGKGPDAAVAVAWHRDDGEVNAMTIPIQTGTNRPSW